MFCRVFICLHSVGKRFLCEAYLRYSWKRMLVNPLPFGFALLRFVIGLENSHHSLHQSDSKLKPIATWSHAFSRASGSLLVFALSFPWLFEIFLLAMISLCDCFGFGWPTHLKSALKMRTTPTYTILADIGRYWPILADVGLRHFKDGCTLQLSGR